MSKIVYGVAGEGSGHSSRARVMVGFLESIGHSVKVVTYDRGLRNLQDDFDVFEIEGLHIASINNKVSKLKTVITNLSRLSKGAEKLKALRTEIFETFKPDCVITDFEPMTAYLANYYDLPLITIDNQHRLRYMIYPYPRGLTKERLLTETIVRFMVPKPDVSLVTTFYFGPLKNDRTFLFPPILRKEVLALESSRKDHVLVYLTSGFESFLDVLKTFKDEHFIVYGYNMEKQDGNMTFKPHSKDGFLQDLSSCKAVMATAGFTLMTEALYLRKPYLALPMTGQFEQAINAVFLDRLGYGMNLRGINFEPVSQFFDKLPAYENALKSYQSIDNALIQQKLQALIDNKCEEAKRFHKKREKFIKLK